MQIKNWIDRYSHILLFCFISAVISFSTNITSSIVDNFHEGEYLGFVWHMRSYYNNLAEFPLLIHGAVDYIPSVIASFVYGDEHIIVGTRQIGAVILWLEWVLFLELCYLLIPESNQKKCWMAGVLVVFFILSPKLSSDYMTMHGAIVGLKDFFLILTIWSFAKYLTASSKSAIYLFLWLTSFGAAASIFWCYDRGVMATAFFGVAVLGCIFTKRLADALFLTLSAILSLILIGYSNVVGSTMSNIGNIKYWIMYGSELWSYPFETHFLPYLGGGIMVLFSMAAIVMTILQKHVRAGKVWILLVGLVVVQLLLLKTTMNRPGGTRTLAAIWPPMLLMLYFAPILFPIPNLNLRKYFSSKISIPHVIFYFASALFFLASINIQTLNLYYILTLHHNYLKYGSFLKNIVYTRKDTELVSNGVNQLASELKRLGNNCYLGWSSEGVIALMSKERFCTKFTYSAYVSSNEEGKLLAGIKRDPPKVVVFDSIGGQMQIDDIWVKDRLPAIYHYIDSTYSTKTKVAGGLFILATRE
ncbi:MAG: hypothetical protein H7240_07480 [Glaciimonas sp.]|nr:hypothetical protein [Glaciimonas sp.]